MTTEEQQEYTSKVISSDNCYLDCSIKQIFSEPVNSKDFKKRGGNQHGRNIDHPEDAPQLPRIQT